MPDVTRISLPQKFSFDCHEWFKDEYSKAIVQSKRVELLCDKVQFLDSAALGMIAKLKKEMKKHTNHDITVSNPSTYCDDLFTLANMYENYVVKSSKH
ncbi:STAS domain-containing protein [Marinomonas ostreistagni]|uniref:STAS domain-containing protein n=1 Tax=Marinomonas ostreistagni TaxID=359209 RepID=A0ABS0ZFV9_9GAMM|nr:STAS domain-containing protein [Marinomonas ostreistagni]MBJ7552517.1 STAS domain-containing protein [Marinomonas ostreistagni]